MPRNIAVTRSGKSRAVCQWCGRMSAPKDQVTLSTLAEGWGVAPFPSHVVHADGSTGDLFRCPPCGERRDFPISPKLDR